MRVREVRILKTNKTSIVYTHSCHSDKTSFIQYCISGINEDNTLNCNFTGISKEEIASELNKKLDELEKYNTILFKCDYNLSEEPYQTIINERLKKWDGKKTIILDCYRYHWQDMSPIDSVFVESGDNSNKYFTEYDADIYKIRSEIVKDWIVVGDIGNNHYIKGISIQLTDRINGEEIVISKDGDLLSLCVMQRDHGRSCFSTRSVEEMLKKFNEIHEDLMPKDYNRISGELSEIKEELRRFDKIRQGSNERETTTFIDNLYAIVDKYKKYKEYSEANK